MTKKEMHDTAIERANLFISCARDRGVYREQIRIDLAKARAVIDLALDMGVISEEEWNELWAKQNNARVMEVKV